MLVGAEQRDPSVTLLGRRRPHPLIVAPTASQRLAHPDGELATAQAAAATGASCALSTFATTTLPEVAQAAPDATRWFQLYVFPIAASAASWSPRRSSTGTRRS